MMEETKPEENLQKLADLISAPLMATVEANAKMSKAQVDFLLECCFTKNGDSYAPKMIQLQMTKKVITPAVPGEIDQTAKIVDGTTSFSVPLMTIMPLNSLAVNHVDVKFEMDITQLEVGQEGETQLMWKLIQDTKEEGIKMDISITADQIPLPIGLMSIIDAFSKNIQPTSS